MTKNTDQLIESLARGVSPVKPMGAPERLLAQLLAVLVIYAFGIGLTMGFRDDIALQLHRPFYLAEVLLLTAITVSSLFACICLSFPDEYQHPVAVRLPALGFTALVLLLLVQAFLPQDARMVIPDGAAEHGMECTECIAALAAIPSLLMFFFLKRGASVRPFASGACAVLASAAIGSLAVRLREANDSLLHVTFWHYIPTLVFATFGAVAGKFILKW